MFIFSFSAWVFSFFSECQSLKNAKTAGQVVEDQIILVQDIQNASPLTLAGTPILVILALAYLLYQINQIPLMKVLIILSVWLRNLNFLNLKLSAKIQFLLIKISLLNLVEIG